MPRLLCLLSLDWDWALASDYSPAVGLARWGARSRCRIISLKLTYATAVELRIQTKAWDLESYGNRGE